MQKRSWHTGHHYLIHQARNGEPQGKLTILRRGKVLGEYTHQHQRTSAPATNAIWPMTIQLPSLARRLIRVMLCLDVEFIAVPSDKALDAFFHCNGWLVVKLLDQVGHIGVGIGHIPGLQRQ